MSAGHSTCAYSKSYLDIIFLFSSESLLLFDIFRIYQDYLDVSKELSITNSNNNMNKIIVEEIKHCNIIISTIITKLIVIENKLIIIENKLKKSQK